MNEQDIQAMLASMQGGKPRGRRNQMAPATPQEPSRSGVHGPVTLASLPRGVRPDNDAKVQIDLRSATRFSENPNSIGIAGNREFTRKGSLMSRWALDPVEKFLQESQGALDQRGLQEALFQIPVARPNFSPLHEILNKRNWSQDEQAVALRHVLEYGIESVPDSTERGLDRLYGNPPRSALQAALEQRNYPAVQMLVEAGANTHIMDRQGVTPIAHAILSGMPEAIPLLLSKTTPAWTSRQGDTLLDLSLESLETQSLLQSPDKIAEEIETFYQSIATIKQFKLQATDAKVDREKDPEGDKAFNEKLDAIQERFDAILKQRQLQPLGGYFNTMIEQVKSLEPLDAGTISEHVGPKTHRAFTNPGKGISDTKRLDFLDHPWAFLFRGLDVLNDKMDRANAMEISRQRVYFRMAEMPPGKGTPDYDALYGSGKGSDEKYAKALAHYMDKLGEIDTQMRDKINLDLVLTNYQDLSNSEGDTLLTKAMRAQSFDVAEALMNMDVNMHARDAKGQTAMHILAATCNDKKAFTNMITGLVGKPDGAGGRTSMFHHGNTADWDIRNNDGETFLDVLQKTHPEWVADIEHHLGVKNVQAPLPEWSMARVLALGGPEKVLALALSAVPTLDPLPDTALPSERREHTDKALNIMNNVVHQLENTQEPSKVTKLMGHLDGVLSKCDSTTKMGLVLGLMKEDYDLDSPQRETVLLQAAGALARDISTAGPRELEAMFDLSNRITDATEPVWKSQELATHMIVQAGISMGNTDLQELGQLMEKRLREVAAQKYSMGMDNEHDGNGAGASTGPSKGNS